MTRRPTHAPEHALRHGPSRPDGSPSPAPGLRRRHWLQALAALAPGLALTGCGGGAADGGAGPATPAAAPTDTLRQPLRGIDSGGTGRWKAVFVSAPVASIGPLNVRGLSFDTSVAAVVDGDGAPLALATVMPGMGCEVSARQWLANGTVSSTVAATVRVTEQLRGPLAAVDAAAGEFTLLGQRVVVTGGTLWDSALPGGLAALASGQWLVVWGQLDVAGARIVATRLAPADAAAVASGGAVVRGVLSALDRQAGSASIGALQLTYAAGADGTVPDGLAVGQVVRARLAPAAADAGLPATLWSLRADALQLPDKSEAELEGRVTRVDSARRFAVDGVEVEAEPSAWTGTVLQPALGLRVSVSGQAADGLLKAREVQAESDEQDSATGLVELEGSVAAPDATSSSFTLRGIPVQWSAATVFKGGGAALLTNRRKVAVLGRWNADHTVLLARSIHVES